MVKKMSGMGRLSVGLVLGLSAVVAHAAGSPLNAQQLGIFDRVLKFCGPVDPALSKKLEAKIAELIKGHSADEVAKARGSEKYKEGYQSMDSFVSQVDDRNAKTLCSESANK
ncbi:MAG TPA: hypothetical protein VHY75_09615 [Steroidobacteraceae bacterium]|jgi:hypothetical protein|nr:hypothetical protein [Steroidobacteraceae bacterium]